MHLFKLLSYCIRGLFRSGPTVSPALLHDGVEVGRTMKRLLETKAVGLVDGFEDLLTWKG